MIVYQTLRRFLFFSILLVVSMPLAAADLVVTRYFSGLWDQPHQESQGIVLQIIDQEEDGNKKAVAYWFTYGDDLAPNWFVGIGHVEMDRVLMTLYTADGIGFMQEDLPETDNVYQVGSLELQFKNCNKGTAIFDIGDGLDESGEFEIQRLASIYNSRCSGGISDDTPSDAKPLKLEVDLDPARDGIEGEGEAKFWERADRSDFQVEAEDIPDGAYSIVLTCADGVPTPVGPLVVDDGEGATHFRSPQAAGKELLTFYPRDCLIEVHDGEGAVLSSGDRVLGDEDAKDEDDDDDGDDDGDDDKGDDGNEVEIEVELENTGIIEDAEGEASYETDGDGEEFEVEIEDVPAGFYPLYVAGDEKGVIEVVAKKQDDDDDEDGSSGKIRFSDPQKDGWLPLEFDPRGELVEVLWEGQPILEVLFPE